MAPLVEEIKKQDIVDQLTWDDSVNANEVHVNVSDGTVHLTGTVPNYAAKLAAETDAYSVAGVRFVENDLDVEYPTTVTIPEDIEITESINNMLRWNSNINATNISVETSNSIVTLRGTVDSYWEKYLAEDIANTAYGVLGVINLIEVTLKKTIVDIDIENDIRRAFQRSFFIDENKINVSVNNGTVTLHGTVANYPVKKEALDIAKYTSGVIEVIDEITIE